MNLKDFARSMIADGRLLLRPLPEMQMFGRCMEVILYRDGALQAELVAIPAGVSIGRHRHNRAASIDVMLAGSLDGFVGVHKVTGRNTGELERDLFPVPRGAWHGGSSGPSGVIYLSFQEWHGTPGFISEDWEA